MIWRIIKEELEANPALEEGEERDEQLEAIGKIADEICIVRTMQTEAINHDPALTFMQTGAQVGNRPSMGAWLSYGLGSENQNLPNFCVLLSRGRGNGQGVYSKLWTNGFLDSYHQGVQFSAGEEPVLYLNDPKGTNRQNRRRPSKGQYGAEIRPWPDAHGRLSPLASGWRRICRIPVHIR